MKHITEISRLRSRVRSLFFFFLLLLAGGCTEADVLGGGSLGQEQTGEVEAAFTLQVMAGQAPLTRSLAFTADGSTESDTLVVAAPDTLSTRAATPDAGTEQERTISNVWVGQYDTAGNLLYSDYSTVVAGANTVTVKLKPATGCSVWFVINAGDLGQTAADATRTEALLKAHQLSCATADGKLPGEGQPPGGGLCVMTGMWSGTVPAAGIAPGQAGAVELRRLTAKVTFTYTIKKSLDFSFTPTSVSLKQLSGTSQVGAPAVVNPRPTGITYDGSYDLTGADITGNPKTIEWYLAENMAGNGDAVASLKERIGLGVTDATYIELAGNAVQKGVGYSNVVIRFYPGDPDLAKLNNYNIERNGHYRMNITLGGLDLTDKRITIGTIPSITNPANLPAAKGTTADVRITARPGQGWMLDLPLWLSATIVGKIPAVVAPGGSKLDWQGPCMVRFTSVESNPKAEVRSVGFPIVLETGKQPETLTLTQELSELSLPGGTTPTRVNIAAATGSTVTFSFTATAGLLWNAAFSADWLGWAAAAPAPTAETTGRLQTYTVATVSTNPLQAPRTATITLKAGASVGDPAYTGLQEVITVEQRGSDFSLGTVGRIRYGGGSVNAQVTATAGLQWTVSPVESNGIRVSPLSGSGSTQLTFTAPRNSKELSSITGSFTVTVTGTSRTAPIQVIQEGLAKIRIDQDMADLYKAAQTNMSSFPPFRYDGGVVTATGMDRSGCVSNSCTVNAPYSIEVSKEQNSTQSTYAEAIGRCPSGWRIPTMIELFAIYRNRDSFGNIDGFKGFKGGVYWSSSVGSNNAANRANLSFSNRAFTNALVGASRYARCVRDTAN